MIHLVIGTKAQLIKMVGIIKELEKNNIEYNYIDTGQHAILTKELRKQFKIREPDYEFVSQKTNITSNSEGIKWMIYVFFKFLFNRKKIFKGTKKQYCLVHGDTTSTFLGCWMSILGRQKIVHIEAGERTNNVFKPFPEEIIRRFTDKHSTLCFASSNETEAALKKEKIKGKIINVKENTLIDAVNLAKTQSPNLNLPSKFILVSIHRYETIHSKKRMTFIVDMLITFAKDHKIIWGLHEPTKNALKRFELLNKLEKNNNISLRGLFPYFEFIQTISSSQFLVTDGGGPQDETRYLGISCLLMRTETERPGYDNVYLCKFCKENVNKFFKTNKKNLQQDNQCQPSKKITKTLNNKE